MTNLCPCNSRYPYTECCAPIHSAATSAKHAEQIMRARYSAHVQHNIDFILNTWHPSCQVQLDREKIANWCRSSEWLGLQIVKTEPDLLHSHVTFVATYRDSNGVIHHHKERSRFLFGQQQWWYLDGEVCEYKPGRNNPCPCGSDKKYKRCCGI